jgi:hypothetical protein
MNENTKILNTIKDYKIGDLSIFPKDLDNEITLHNAKNNSISVLMAKLNINSNYIYVNDNYHFPEYGIIRINDELIYYKNKDVSSNCFYNLIRGFNGSMAMNHNSGSVVLGCVSSLHHNSIRDAIIKCEQKIGLISDLPDINGTLTSRVKYLDIKWFTPSSKYIGYPRRGYAPLLVNFLNLSIGEPYIDFEWDFGDPYGSSDINEKFNKNTSHTYLKPGNYTVTLKLKSTGGKKSFLTKNKYIEVFDNNVVYDVIAYSRNPQNYKKLSINSYGIPDYDSSVPLTVQFVDQTRGIVIKRKWNFGDGNFEITEGSYNHIINHTYIKEGIFWPELQVVDYNETIKTYKFRTPIVVGQNEIISKEELILGKKYNETNTLIKSTIGYNINRSNDNIKLNDSIIIG